ncbi:multisubunit Na+/H+ antiporter, MnhE subunit [Desulfitobacterium dichloroeliminans LMG P-21439]|uniref:Multisubunit Na+/H+ antiporter, MnhE subunit n=1 Tax=Desulfitobacterium dichloroeliminans (strain LMG P-21439 / DCA1) TaxID=871963 RepID=L0F3E9_DESDL|nr:Na+/H+ antiporter subunit E [Desulfitobacterium dichloroeliminans]AGA67702.1 multisubunit Na+/H+ antiporter, MnhE subunit [Desulfitobacterium dichloroeliminans LMG P-21439]
MAIQLLLNIFTAFLWMFFRDAWSGADFFLGYLVGLSLIFIMKRFFRTPFYLIKLWAMAKFLYVAIWEIFSSSIFVLKLVLKPRMNFRPGIFALHTQLEGAGEVTLLSLLITLTPGSVVLEVSPDGKILYIHAMDLANVKDTVLKSIHALEKAIMEVTRDV